MDDVQRFDRVFFLDDCMSAAVLGSKGIEGGHRLTRRNVNLAGSLADHFNVDLGLCQAGEHQTGRSDGVAHITPDEGQDRHVFGDCHVADASELFDELVEPSLGAKVLHRHRHLGLALGAGGSSASTTN